MKIVDRTENIEVTLADIKIGDAFYYHRTGALYMRTENLSVDGVTIANAVNLRLGSLCAFPLDYKVIAVECECVVYDK